MSGFYKKAVVWLGLNEEYPEDAVGDESWAQGDSATANGSVSVPSPAGDRSANQERSRAQRVSTSSMAQTPLAPAPLSPERDSATVRPVPLDSDGAGSVSRDAASPAAVSVNRQAPTGPTDGGSSGTVRAVPMAVVVPAEVVVPESFNNAQDVADVYKASKAVIVDLNNAERDLARRLIDFSAGLCYGLGGQMEKLATDVYLLVPEGVEVSDKDRERYS